MCISPWQESGHPTLVVKGNLPLLQNEYISGKVVLISDSLIGISSNCHLEDVIVIAPEIKISDGFSGITSIDN